MKKSKKVNQREKRLSPKALSQRGGVAETGRMLVSYLMGWFSPFGRFQHSNRLLSIVPRISDARGLGKAEGNCM